MEKLLIVDGSNLLFQMFYGMPARIVGKHGKPVHGTLGFVGALLKIIQKVCPTHVVALFDGEHENARTEIDEQYKANRPDYSLLPEEETPFCQLPDIYAALDYLKIKHTETTDCETDDMVAGYAKSYGERAEILILSFDSDFFQLVGDTVRVLRYRGEQSTLCDCAYIRERYGVLPSQYADWKALVGDGSDNIQGVKGIGPKTAAALLSEFGDLDGVLQNAEKIQKKAAREGILCSKVRIEKNRALIRLTGYASLPFALEELAYRYGGERTGEILTAIGVR